MSLRISQSSDQVTRANPPSVSAGITLLCWAYVSVDRNDYSTMARISTGGGTITTWSTESDGLAGPNYFTTGGNVVNATNFAVGAWRKIAISCSGTTAHAYVQIPGGSTEHDSGTVNSSGTPDLLALGGRGDVGAAEFWNGRLAYFRLYSAELTQTEIETEWNSATAVRTSNLWASWPLISDLNDVSGNARHLTAGSTSGGFEANPPINVTGTLGSTMLAFTADLDGDTTDPTVAGDLDATMLAFTADLAGTNSTSGGLDASMPLAVADLAAANGLLGDLDATMPAFTADVAGAITFTGAVDASMPMIRCDLAGLAIDPGALVLPLRAGTPTLTAQHRAGTVTLTPQLRAGAPV